MPRKTRKAELQAQQDPQVLPFFDDEGNRHRPDLLRDVREKRYEHTGARMMDNEPECIQMVGLILAQTPIRSIARIMHVSRHTVRECMKELRGQGKLAPFKEAAVEMMSENILTGLQDYRDALEKGLIAPAQIPLHVAIFADKRAVMLGEASSIMATITGDGRRVRELSVESLNAWAEDAQSSVRRLAAPHDAAMDAASAAQEAPVPPAAPVGTPAGPEVPPGGGGGITPPAPPDAPTSSEGKL
jgi:hypothetical protein